MVLLSQIDVFEKRVFLRADLDVPLKNGKVEDDWRLRNLLPTIRYLTSQKATIILAGHIGRPEGKPIFNLSTKFLLTELSKLLDNEVVHIEGFPAAEVIDKTLGLQRNAILLLENLRFFGGEEENDQVFARKLANLANFYVNEAFAASHRNHTSIVGVPKFLPHAAGFHFAKEVEILTRVLEKPERPLVVVIGGAKIETKLPVIENLAKIAEFILVGGKLPLEIQENQRSKIKNQNYNSKIKIAKLIDNGKDINQESIDRFKEIIVHAKTLIWNGPMGVFEDRRFERGTREIAKAIANSSAEKIVGGGETIWALKKYGVDAKIDWISSGGGAMLEFLAGKKLPGIAALEI
jgi:phosphoglycerate kinase